MSLKQLQGGKKSNWINLFDMTSWRDMWDQDPIPIDPVSLFRRGFVYDRPTFCCSSLAPSVTKYVLFDNWLAWSCE